MSKYQAYPEYKDSGVDSAPEMPNNWIAGKVKYVTESLDKIRVPLSAEERGDRKGEYPYYGASGVIDYVDDYLFDEETILFGEDGANLIARSSPLAFLAKGKYWVNNHAHILKTKDGVNDYWVMCLENIDVTTVVSGSAQPKLTAEALGDLQIVYPSTILEREKIANFLDHETAKIDTLIEKQQQLIKLLKEKRQAVISHAVTKGLNPNAPMKDSGVEWLGDVPGGWDIPKIKWFYKTESGGTPNTSNYEKYYKDGDIAWIRTTDLNNGDLYETPVAITDKAVVDSACSVLPVNSVLVAMYGGAGTIGKHSLLKFESTINQAVCAILPNDKIDPEFLHLFVEFYRPYWMVGAEGTRKDPNINQEVIRELMVPCPPPNEQSDIVKVTKKKLTVIDVIVAKSELNIQFMQERRTALISAAVTGKIDVRNWVVPLSSMDSCLSQE